MRSQTRSDLRLPDPPDDWAYGSWTVDCSCGVTFDDGEEMVKCDECGVWVHTRCSHYVKSEKSFACHKCKTRENKKFRDDNKIENKENDENEVAELLASLPTNTVVGRSIDNSNPTNPNHGFRRQLWTQIPMEERVHVQGIPGGNRGIFGSGLSSIFGPELWKCTGYVPKKFDFPYREFECWDEGNENPANIGSGDGVEFSSGFATDSENLVKVVSSTDCSNLVNGMEKQIQETDVAKKGDGENVDVISSPRNVAEKKDKSSVHPTVIYYGKRKKEDLPISKDSSGKKKSKIIHIEGEDSKNNNAHTSKSVSTLSSDAKKLDSHEGRGLKNEKNATQSEKHENLKRIMPCDPSAKGSLAVGHEPDNSVNNLAFSGQAPEACVMLTQRFSVKATPQNENDGVSAMHQISPKISDGTQLSLEHVNCGSLPANHEDVSVALDKVDDGNGERSGRSKSSNPQKPKNAVEYLEASASQVKESLNDQDTKVQTTLNYLHHNKVQVDRLNSRTVFDVQSSSPCDGKLDNNEPLHQQPTDRLPENVAPKGAATGGLHSIDDKAEDVSQSNIVADCQKDKAETSLSEPCQMKRQLVVSEGPRIGKERSSELKQDKHTEEPSKSGDSTICPSERPSQRKMVVSVKKSSTKSTILISKSSTSDIRKASDVQNYKSSRQKGIPEDKIGSGVGGFVKDSDGYERSKKIAKEHPKSSASSVKTSLLSKSPLPPSTRKLSESKEPLPAKPSLVQNNDIITNSGESNSSMQTDSAFNVVNKNTASGNEMIDHVNSQPSVKVNHAAQVHHPAAPTAPTTLSDEELALLLHQELNSSPRVPRVPRMRHAGSLPQIASPNGTSTLMKRSSSGSVGKDHGLVFKRKGKNVVNEGSHNFHEHQNESKNVNRSSTLPVQRTKDLARTADSASKGEPDYGSGIGVKSVRSVPRASTAGSASIASDEATERSLSSTRESPQNASDDDAGGIVRPTHRTLPGLLSEIMSKRMSYEELCNAVLPHWPHLRKHNGERYAYSSHSQAVLDCLRNRSEWARLVDRGPKTNAGRKRRRSDAEAPFESEDNEGNKKNKDVDSKSFETNQEQFPKGKRKARKRRRRLALHGRGIKDIVGKRGTKQQKDADDVSYDDDVSLHSNTSSAESMFSEDDDMTIQGGGGCLTSGQCDAPTSSDE